MYRVTFIFCVLPIFVIFLSGESECARIKREVQMYTTKYDHVDVDSILASTRLLRNYINCLLDQGACTAEGKTLKQYLPDAIATGCTKCNPAQKKIAGKILSELLLKHREDFDKLSEKYDPDGTFRAMYFSEDDDYNDLEEA